MVCDRLRRRPFPTPTVRLTGAMAIFIARHAETVYNADARMQGHATQTPLTRRGIAQADAMGAALAAALGPDPALHIWASSSGRTLQTAAMIAEYLGCGYFDIRADPRLLEIDVGEWTGRRYADVEAEIGPIMCRERHVFTARPPGGEWYPAIAARLRDWLADLTPGRDVLAVTHGVTSRVLRGLLVGGETFEGVALAGGVPQGTVVRIDGETESLISPDDMSVPYAR